MQREFCRSRTVAWFVIAATFFTATPADLWAREVTSLCANHLANLSNEITDLAFDVVPPLARQAVRKEYPSTARLFIQLPVSDIDFRKIFGKKPVSASDKDELRDVREKLKAVNRNDGDRGVNADNFEKFLGSTKESFVVVVGHNERGTFKFLDGSGEGIGDLANACAAAGKLCVFVSCQSRSHLDNTGALGLSREVTFVQGIYIAKKVSEFINSRTEKATTPEVLASRLSRVELVSHLKHRVTYLIFKGCGSILGVVVVAIIIQALEDDCDGGKKPCPQR